MAMAVTVSSIVTQIDNQTNPETAVTVIETVLIMAMLAAGSYNRTTEPSLILMLPMVIHWWVSMAAILSMLGMAD